MAKVSTKAADKNGRKVTTFSLDEQTRNSMSALCELTGARSNAEVLRRSVDLYRRLTEKTQGGKASMFVREKSGKETEFLI